MIIFINNNNIVSYEDKKFEICTLPDSTYKPYFKSVVFGNDVFVVGGMDSVLYSKDGKTFYEGSVEEDAINNTNKIIYGNKMFVAVGINSLAWSEDGVNFYKGCLKPTQTGNYYLYNDVAYCDINKSFVTVTNRIIAYSNNGVDFFTSSAPLHNYTNIVIGDGVFIAYERLTTHFVYSTDGGKSFTEGTGISRKCNKIVFTGGLFIALGENYIAWSKTGKVFNEGIIPKGNYESSDRSYESVAYGEGMFVAIGYGCFACSFDCRQWYDDIKVFPVINGTFNNIFYTEDKFVAYGYNTVVFGFRPNFQIDICNTLGLFASAIKR